MIMNFSYTIIRSYIARITVAEGLVTDFILMNIINLILLMI